MLRIIAVLASLALAGVLVIVTWPQLLGLEHTWIVAQAVAMRGLLVVGGLVGGLVLGLLAAARPIRLFAGTAAVLLIAFGIANAAILAERGFGNGTLDEATDETVTVLAWNTLGDEPGAQAVAELAVDVQADVISLPETTEAAGIAIAETMRSLGRPMWVHTTAFDQISPARSTTVLVNPALGDYSMVTSDTERSENTRVLPTVILEPADGDGPRIIAAHAVAPIAGQMHNWRADLTWLSEQCTGENTIMAGDFNATVDHMHGLGTNGGTLGTCVDAATQSGDGAVGTWPTWLPALAGSPIDHVMATSDWTVDDVQVLDRYDRSGSDHRPIVARLSAAER